MYAIFLKEVQQFFSTLIGYMAIIVFLLVLGLFVWVFPDTNVLDFGYATLDSFFDMAPYILIFLIPAITMRSFAEEINSGTIELLATRPVTDLQIILGKYFAALLLVVIAIVPTIVYLITVYFLASPVGNIDLGGMIGSYFGLLFLGAVFVAIGIFCSSITANQIVAFIAGVFLCFLPLCSV
jgi:ABC-2 type transport system permease protein